MKNNKTLIFLVLTGLGIYYYMRNKNKAEKKDNTIKPDISLVPQSAPANDFNISFSINGYKKRLGNVPNTI
jgi:hypothetical protein